MWHAQCDLPAAPLGAVVREAGEELEHHPRLRVFTEVVQFAFTDVLAYWRACLLACVLTDVVAY